MWGLSDRADGDTRVEAEMQKLRPCENTIDLAFALSPVKRRWDRLDGRDDMGHWTGCAATTGSQAMVPLPGLVRRFLNREATTRRPSGAKTRGRGRKGGGCSKGRRSGEVSATRIARKDDRVVRCRPVMGSSSGLVPIWRGPRSHRILPQAFRP